MQNQRVAPSKTIVDFPSSWLLTGSQELLKHFHACHTVDGNMVQKTDTPPICLLYIGQSLLLSSLSLNDMNFVFDIQTSVHRDIFL